MARETSRIRADLHRQKRRLRDRLAVSQGVIDLLRDPATAWSPCAGPAPTPKRGAAWCGTKQRRLSPGRERPAAASRQGLRAVDDQRWTARPAGLFTVDASGRATIRSPPRDLPWTSSR